MLAECASVNVIVDGTGCAKPCAAIFAVVSKDQFTTLEISNSSSENFATSTGLDSLAILHNNNSNNKASNNNNNNDLLTSSYEVEAINQVSFKFEEFTRSLLNNSYFVNGYIICFTNRYKIRIWDPGKLLL